MEAEIEETKQGVQEARDTASASSVGDMFRGTDLCRALPCFGVILSHPIPPPVFGLSLRME